MTLRDDLLGVIDSARGIAADLGMHQVLVSIRTRTWSEGRMQSGIPTDVTLIISPTPHVRGSSGDPEVLCGPITPAYPATNTMPAGGYTPAQLNPSQANGIQYFYSIAFNDGVTRNYVVQDRGLDTSTPMRYMLKLKALDRGVPF